MEKIALLGVSILISLISLAEEVAVSSPSVTNAVLDKYSEGYEKSKLDFVRYDSNKNRSTDNRACTDLVSKVRQHSFLIFGGATGLGYGYYLSSKAIVKQAMMNEIDRINAENDRIEQLINKREHYHGTAVETSSKLKSLNAESASFQEAYKQLKFWVATLDPSVSGTSELRQEIQNFESATSQLKKGTKELAVLRENYEALQKSGASAESIEKARAALADKGLEKLKSAAKAKMIFNEGISGKVVGTAYRSFLRDKAVLQTRQIDAVAGEERVAAVGARASSSMAKTGMGVVAAGGAAAGALVDFYMVGSMAQGDAEKVYPKTEAILSEKISAATLCRSVAELPASSQDEFRSNLNRLTTAMEIDDHKLTKINSHGTGVGASASGQR